MFHVLVEFGESRKVVSLKEGNSMVKLTKDAFGTMLSIQNMPSSLGKMHQLGGDHLPTSISTLWKSAILNFL